MDVRRGPGNRDACAKVYVNKQMETRRHSHGGLHTNSMHGAEVTIGLSLVILMFQDYGPLECDTV